MGTSRLFWSQETLDQLIVDDKVSMEGDSLTIIDDRCSYKVKQAVFFKADVGDGEDVFRLVGRVKELSTLEAMGAEHYMDSVIMEDSAYQVTCGFVGELVSVSDINRTTSEQSSSNKAEDADQNDKELLAKFLIENL